MLFLFLNNISLSEYLYSTFHLMKWVLHILYDTCEHAKQYCIVEEIECVVEKHHTNEWKASTFRKNSLCITLSSFHKHAKENKQNPMTTSSILTLLTLFSWFDSEEICKDSTWS